MALKYIIPAVLLVVAAGTVLFYQRQEDARTARYYEALEYGASMERNQRFSEAVLAYEAALDLELTARERAEVRERLARALITGNSLSGALGVLRDLAAEDVARFNIDIGPLYLELGRKARETGLVDLARIALREGSGVSPARQEEFSERLLELGQGEGP